MFFFSKKKNGGFGFGGCDMYARKEEDEGTMGHVSSRFHDNLSTCLCNDWGYAEQEKDVDRLITRLVSRDEAHIVLMVLMKWRTNLVEKIYNVGIIYFSGKKIWICVCCWLYCSMGEMKDWCWWWRLLDCG